MLGDLLGVEKPREITEEVYKKVRVSPWDIINAINAHQTDLITEDNEEQCKKEAFFVNRGLSFGADTVIYANEMNARHHLDYKLQFDFLINTIRPRKRYNKWIKAETVEVLEVIQEYHGYSIHKARQVLPLFTPDQIILMKKRLNKGGE
jgi:hypothetical protein